MSINDQIKNASLLTENFLLEMKINSYEYKFTSKSEFSPFACVFSIFLRNLIKKLDLEINDFPYIQTQLIKNFYLFKEYRIKTGANLNYDKPYLQLLTFTLSCLSILKNKDHNLLSQDVENFINNEAYEYLTKIGALKGKPGSGNLAMFLAICYIHAREYLNIDKTSEIDTWVDLHLKNMNEYGFWSNSNKLTYLQFQNGYHQYEIFKYLNIPIPEIERSIETVMRMGDSEGHFAPYPGGGGCYDFDAIYVLTYDTKAYNTVKDNLLLTASSILNSQNSDGGFCETKYLSPRSLGKSLSHIFNPPYNDILFKFRVFLNTYRKKYKNIKTHWTTYERRWDESNLWDTWFRLMALAKIQIYIQNNYKNNWNFIDYPGIGFYNKKLNE